MLLGTYFLILEKAYNQKAWNQFYIIHICTYVQLCSYCFCARLSHWNVCLLQIGKRLVSLFQCGFIFSGMYITRKIVFPSNKKPYGAWLLRSPCIFGKFGFRTTPVEKYFEDIKRKDTIPIFFFCETKKLSSKIFFGLKGKRFLWNCCVGRDQQFEKTDSSNRLEQTWIP
jgi:hypothetical protein